LTFQYTPNLELGDIEAARALLTKAATLAALGDAPTTKRTIENMRLGFAAVLKAKELSLL
jgi:hypothetical protein